MTTNLPWRLITTGGGDAKLRLLRVDAEHSLDFYWGKDAEGRFLLVLRLKNAIQQIFKEPIFRLAGITGDFRKSDESGHMLVLTLQDIAQADIFHRLCLDLVESSRNCGDEILAADVIMTRMKRWQAFLSRKNRGLLKPHEVQGLFAEISFLAELVVGQGFSVEAAINAWVGPKEAPQDFILGKYAVEVKSICGSNRNTVRISSENQLVNHLESLFLRIFYLTEDATGNAGESLNGLVRRLKIDWQSHEPAAVLAFEDILHAAGYLELPEYDLPRYHVIRTSTYLVSAEFPKIDPSSLKPGVKNVAYDIDLSLLKGFESAIPNKGAE